MSPLPGKGVAYALRAETVVDVEAFFVALVAVGVRVTAWSVRPLDVVGLPDVKLVFSLDGCPVETLRTVLRDVEDGHVMLETLAPTAEYTGERRAAGKAARK